MTAERHRSRWIERLRDELIDDGVAIDGDDAFRDLVLEELDHCRRSPVFEGHQPTYGAMILPTGGARIEYQALYDRIPFDIVPLDGDLAAGRLYADGRASYLVRRGSDDHDVALACFERTMIFEADLVHLQQLTGAAIVQRTPVLGVVRLAVDGAMINWDGRHWRRRPTATALADLLCERAPDLDDDVAVAVLELAIHWLAPSRIGATIVIHDELDPSALDTTTAAHTPPLSIGNRRHYSALVAVLRQHDLATVVGADGEIRKLAVGLRWSDAAEATIDNDRGMRHRSAQRYSFDQPDAVVVVVSEDGPVTVYRHGSVVATTGTGGAPSDPPTRPT